MRFSEKKSPVNRGRRQLTLSFPALISGAHGRGQGVSSVKDWQDIKIIPNINQ